VRSGSPQPARLHQIVNELPRETSQTAETAAHSNLVFLRGATRHREGDRIRKDASRAGWAGFMHIPRKTGVNRDLILARMGNMGQKQDFESPKFAILSAYITGPPRKLQTHL
jgi:hypothetical protein